MTGNASLDVDLGRLAQAGYQTDVQYEGQDVGVLVRAVPLRPGLFNRPTTDLLLRTTLLYPQSEMDMFWVNDGLRLANGATPANADSVEMHFGQGWQRFSWHRNSPWKPGRDDLVSHLEFCLARLERPE